MKFGMLAHIRPLPWTDHENTKFLKIQDGGGRHLENHQYRDICTTVWPIFTKR